MTIKRLQKLKKGQNVRLSQQLKNWHGKHAIECNTIASGFKNKKGMIGCAMDLLLGAGIKHKTTFLEYRDDVGDGPGAKVEIDFGNGIKDYTYVSRKDLE